MIKNELRPKASERSGKKANFSGFSRLSLRTRLLASYLLLLTTALGVIAIALLVFLNSLPAPARETHERLAAIMLGLNRPEVELGLLPGSQSSEFSRREFSRAMDTFAESRNVRALWITVNLESNRAFVVHDSSNIFADRDEIMLTRSDYTNPRLSQVLLPDLQQIFGGFADQNGNEWLYGGIIRVPGRQNNRNVNMLIIAEPRQTVSLQESLATFSNSLVPPIIQAGIVGLLVAIALAYLISRNLSRPLQALSRAARAVANGNFEYRTPETGPPEVQNVAIAFNRMTAEVRAFQQSQRDFLANVTHDLKTPLTSIQGYSQAIIDGATRDPAAAASIIYDEASRLNRMVVNLTDLVRIQSGHLALNLTKLDPGQIIAAVSNQLAVVAQEKGIELTVQNTSLPSIMADGDRLAQVLTNLISNAIKYTPPNGTITITSQPDHGGVEITARDTGIGIPAEELPRIFERFYQVDKSRGPSRGTGLGLAIAREIVDAHGGTIRALSEGEGKGAIFIIWLPLEPSKTAET